MATLAERDTVAKLLLVVVNVFGPPDAEVNEVKEFSVEDLRPLAHEAMAEGQKMLASWGKPQGVQ